MEMFRVKFVKEDGCAFHGIFAGIGAETGVKYGGGPWNKMLGVTAGN
jgi:hypothetical protein